MLFLPDLPDLPFRLASISLADGLAFATFLLCWVFYEPLLRRLSRGGNLNSDMTVMRTAWMRAMARQTGNRFLHGQLMGHSLNSASFFASSNLILIAAVASVLFGGESAWRAVQGLTGFAPAPRGLFEGKLALIVITLSRGLLDFIWAIRQMNYTLAAIGAAPEEGEVCWLERYGEHLAAVLNPAMSAFNAGVRGYYFALAAAAWLLGPYAFAVATLGALGLLLWRQRRSRASRGVRALRVMLEEGPPGDAGGKR